jgi:hypothetical protein
MHSSVAHASNSSMSLALELTPLQEDSSGKP